MFTNTLPTVVVRAVPQGDTVAFALAALPVASAPPVAVPSDWLDIVAIIGMTAAGLIGTQILLAYTIWA